MPGEAARIAQIFAGVLATKQGRPLISLIRADDEVSGHQRNQRLSLLAETVNPFVTATPANDAKPLKAKSGAGRRLGASCSIGKSPASASEGVGLA